MDIRLNPLKAGGKHSKHSKTQPLNFAPSSTDFRLHPTQSYFVPKQSSIESMDVSDSTINLRAPDKLQPVRRGPSRAAGRLGIEDVLETDLRLGKISPDPLRPIPSMKGMSNNSHERDLGRRNSDQETFL